MLQLRKMNYDVGEQRKYMTALPADENGFTNPHEGVSFEEYRDSVLPKLMMHEHPVNMPDWFVTARMVACGGFQKHLLKSISQKEQS